MSINKKAIIMGVSTFENPFNQDDKNELINLCEACNIEVVGLIQQNLDRVNADTFVGPGKIEEVMQMANDLEVDYIVANTDVSARVIRNIDKLTNKIVLDRNMLILEIFTERAKSKSAQIQVEIAKINYELPRLVGSSDHLSKQAGSTGGGLANRGPGETKLELERRELNRLLAGYRKELETLNKQLETQKRQRDKSNIFRVSLVGYTNAGKSTIMNQVLKATNSDKEVFVKDMLFATLDTYTRRIELENFPDFLLSDTIGFINNLHHTLIDAFKSTLQEVSDSDLLLHVIDVSNPNHLQQKKITEDTLKEIGASDIEIIEIYNKADLNEQDITYPDSITVSALNDKDIEKIIDLVKDRLLSDYKETTLYIPYTHNKTLDLVFSNQKTKIIEEGDKGYTIKTFLNDYDLNTLSEYIKVTNTNRH
ncbi:MAG TPA: GTPase HflX [Erysipelotrichaceae bacterium]|nr:GTPase HflX [Erysipelotrichaceae bacterium]